MTAPVAPRFTRLTSRIVPLPDADVDTDQIIPARFLKVTDKLGLGDALFADWRVGRPDCPIGQPEHEGAEILLCGPNFGCGSSREHAPWALRAGGFKALLGTSFADIFQQNALKNGLLPVVIAAGLAKRLFAMRAADAALELTVDLEAQVLELPNEERFSFPVDPFARRCLLAGVDELGYLLGQLPDIEAYESKH